MLATTTAAQRVAHARTELILSSPFFGALSLRLQIREDASVPTMGTDGTELVYSPTFVATLTQAELLACVAHETLHNALQHPYRCAGRDLEQWNWAADYSVNLLLDKQGFTLPKGALLDQQYAGMAAETIYSKLHKKPEHHPGVPTFSPPKPGTPDQNGKPAPAPSGGKAEPTKALGAKLPARMSAQDWQIASEQAAMVARKAGKLPGDLDRTIKEARQSTTDWRTILWEYVERIVPQDFSWAKPNRRYIASGLYLPGLVKENMPRIGTAIDTSGSIDYDLLALFASEEQTILRELRPVALDVAYCDSCVHKTEAFEPDDELVFTFKGGGGTAFQPALDYFSSLPEPPAVVLYFTDLEASDWGRLQAPDYPVLWIVPTGRSRPVPFGEVVEISQW